MEREFFELFSVRKPILDLCVSYHHNSDWHLAIADLRSPQSLPFISIQDCDRSLVFARAYAQLADWYSENFGGY